jgi:ElaB/YqjD/DUF883 family membrane-anchored ribosome-binding protein
MSTTITETLTDNVAEALKSRLDEATTKAKQQGFVQMFRAKTFIEKNPFQSVAIAVGVGYAVKLIKPGPIFTLGLFGGLAYLATRFEMH